VFNPKEETLLQECKFKFLNEYFSTTNGHQETQKPKCVVPVQKYIANLSLWA
jgi:hypothetical protein